MEEARTTAWIMYALALASKTSPANYAAISMIADGINHAVPTHKEMQLSLKQLAVLGLAQKQGSGYSLTEKGAALMSSIYPKCSTAFQVWASLTSALGACPG